MADLTPATVVITQEAGWWVWTRFQYFPLSVLDDNGVATGEMTERQQSASTLYPYADSATALAQAKLVNADLDESAFTVSS